MTPPLPQAAALPFASKVCADKAVLRRFIVAVLLVVWHPSVLAVVSEQALAGAVAGDAQGDASSTGSIPKRIIRRASSSSSSSSQRILAAEASSSLGSGGGGGRGSEDDIGAAARSSQLTRNNGKSSMRVEVAVSSDASISPVETSRQDARGTIPLFNTGGGPIDCVYDSCPAVRVSEADYGAVNGIYFPEHKDCGGDGYGAETFGSRWVGYRRPMTDATLTWLWEDTHWRGWGLRHNERVRYFDGANRDLPKELVLDNYTAREGLNLLRSPQLQCLTTHDIRGMTPLFPIGSSAFLTWADMSRDFDGRSNYLDIADQAPQQLAGAFSILLTARWDDASGFSCALDFGAGDGDNNIAVCSNSTSLSFFVYGDPLDRMASLMVPGAVEPARTRTWLLTMSSAGRMRIWRDGALLADKKAGGVPPRAIWRPSLLLGKSMLAGSRLFKGKLEELRIWNGEALEWSAQSAQPAY